MSVQRVYFEQMNNDKSSPDKKTRPIISIIIPALNEAGTIDRLLNDLLEGADNKVEIIVCDSHSEDDTALIVKRYVQRYANIVKLVQAPQRGVSLARNLGAQEAKGEYLVFLDADARITLKSLLDGVKEMQERDLVAAALKFRSASDYLPDHFLMFLFNLSIQLMQYFQPTAPGAAGYIIKHKAHKTYGGFNQAMHFGEDVEYLRRVSQGGKFRILKQGRIQWDMRRFQQEGRLNVVWKMLWGTVAQLKDVAVTDIPFDYDVGSFHESVNLAENKKIGEPRILALCYQVVGKVPRIIPAEMASPSHFLKRPLEQVDFLQVMKENGKNISPYCLDDKRRCLLFTQTPDGLDLLHADPFFYDAQRDHATKIYALPYASLDSLLEELIDGEEALPVFLHSTGRCGSTLLSQLLGSVEGSLSVSEPDFYSQAMMLSKEASGKRDAELTKLMQNCTRLLSYHLNCGEPSSKLHLIKLRSWAIFGAHLLQWEEKPAKHLFLYRQAEPTVNSFLNAYFSLGQYKFWRRWKLDTLLLRVLGTIPFSKDALGATVPLFNHPEFRSDGRQGADSYFTLQWLSHMDAARDIQQTFPDFFSMVLCYEELKKQPEQYLQRIIKSLIGEKTDFKVTSDLSDILSRDSQAGSRFQSKGEQLLTEADKAQVASLLARHPIEL
jgi:hypothetical protein